MKLHEVLETVEKTGQRFCYQDGTWLCYDKMSKQIQIDFNKQSLRWPWTKEYIVGDEWELEEEKVEVTREQLLRLVCESRVGYKTPEKVVYEFCKKVGKSSQP